MPTFIMLTRVAAEALRSPHTLEDLESKGNATLPRRAP